MAERTLEQAEAELTEARDLIKSLRSESAKYRTQRNSSLKRAHALGVICEKHSIKVEEATADSALAALSVEDGKVSGDFEYTPPRLEGGQQQQTSNGRPGSDTPAALTMETIGSMSADEINKRWDEVSAVMENQ